MTITIETKKFIAATKIATMATERRNAIPILDTMRMQTHGDQIRLTGNDLDRQIDVWIPASISGAGFQDTCIIGHSAIRRALYLAGSDSLEITSEKGERKNDKEHGFTRFASGDIELFDDGLPAVDFPESAYMTDAPAFKVDLGEDFLISLLQVAPAISTEETRYYLNGIHISHEKDWAFRMVATDGHRLFLRDMAWPNAEGNINIDGLQGIIIPRKTVEILREVMQRARGPVTMTYGGTVRKNQHDTLADQIGAPRIRFAMKIGDMDVTITSKTIDGTYPDYRRVIPMHDKTKPAATMNIGRFRKAVEAVRVGSFSSKARPIEMIINGDKMDISANWMVSRRARTSIPCESFGKISVGYNSKYLIDVIQAMPKAENITFGWSDSTSATIIVSPEHPEFQAILMPMRI